MKGPIMTRTSVPLVLDVALLVTYQLRTKHPKILLVVPKPSLFRPNSHLSMPTIEFAPGAFDGRFPHFVGEPNVEGVFCDEDINHAASRLAKSLGLEVKPAQWKNGGVRSSQLLASTQDKRHITIVMCVDLETKPVLLTPDNLLAPPLFYPLDTLNQQMDYVHVQFIQNFICEWEEDGRIWTIQPDGSYMHKCANMKALDAQSGLTPKQGGFPKFTRRVDRIVWSPEGEPQIWIDISGPRAKRIKLACLPGAVKHCPYCDKDLSFGPLE